MPFDDLDKPGEIAAVTRRVFIIGDPNSQKSTSLLTWPSPGIIISLPGEKGYETLRGGAGGKFSTKIWHIDNPETAAPHQIVSEIEKVTFEAIATKPRTLALDGLHKGFEWYYRRARLDVEGWSSAGKLNEDQKNLMAYSPAYDKFLLFLTRICQTVTPYVVMTAWAGQTKDDAEDFKSKSHTFPDLPGKLARWSVGEFSAVVFSEVGQPDPKGNIPGKWILKPVGKIWGVGIKIDPARANTIPPSIPNNFRALAKVLGEPEE
jgi:hypothetical protein